MQSASATLKKLTLELGGKNALIACADASAEEIGEGVVRGMNFRYVTGQSCNSTSRGTSPSNAFMRLGNA